MFTPYGRSPLLAEYVTAEVLRATYTCSECQCGGKTSAISKAS